MSFTERKHRAAEAVTRRKAEESDAGADSLAAATQGECWYCGRCEDTVRACSCKGQWEFSHASCLESFRSGLDWPVNCAICAETYRLSAVVSAPTTPEMPTAAKGAESPPHLPTDRLGGAMRPVSAARVMRWPSTHGDVASRLRAMWRWDCRQLLQQSLWSDGLRQLVRCLASRVSAVLVVSSGVVKLLVYSACGTQHIPAMNYSTCHNISTVWCAWQSTHWELVFQH